MYSMNLWKNNRITRRRTENTECTVRENWSPTPHAVHYSFQSIHIQTLFLSLSFSLFLSLSFSLSHSHTHTHTHTLLHFWIRCTHTKGETSCAGRKMHILVGWNGMFSPSLQQSRQLGMGWDKSGRVRVSVLGPCVCVCVFVCLHLCINCLSLHICGVSDSVHLVKMTKENVCWWEAFWYQHIVFIFYNFYI